MNYSTNINGNFNEVWKYGNNLVSAHATDRANLYGATIDGLEKLQKELESQEDSFFAAFPSFSNDEASKTKLLAKVQKTIDRFDSEFGLNALVNCDAFYELHRKLKSPAQGTEFLNLIVMNDVNGTPSALYEFLKGGTQGEDSPFLQQITTAALSQELKQGNLDELFIQFKNFAEANGVSVGKAGGFKNMALDLSCPFEVLQDAYGKPVGFKIPIEAKFDTRGGGSGRFKMTLAKETVDRYEALGVSVERGHMSGDENAALIKDQVLSYLSTYITNPQILEGIRYEIEQNANRYARLVYSKANLIGVLGEIRGAVLLKAIFSSTSESDGIDNFQVNPAGVLKGQFIRGAIEQTSDKEVPIDIFVNNMLVNFGFQVKNYQLSGKNLSYYGLDEDARSVVLNTFQVGFNAKAYNVVNDKVSNTLQEILLEFFGAEYYHQPYGDDPMASQYASDYQSNLISKNSYASHILDAYVYNVFKFAGQLKSSEDLANIGITGQGGQQPVLYNTFFLLNRFFVPGSYIVKAIIRALKSYDDTELSMRGDNFRTTYSYKVLQGVSTNKTAVPTYQQAHALNLSSGPEPIDAAKGVLITWKAIFSPEQLLSEVYDEIQNQLKS